MRRDVRVLLSVIAVCWSALAFESPAGAKIMAGEPPVVARAKAGAASSHGAPSVRRIARRVAQRLRRNRVCQQIINCNFRRRGLGFRGCVSSFSCRRCRFVRRCRRGARGRVCDWRARCGWGGLS